SNLRFQTPSLQSYCRLPPLSYSASFSVAVPFSLSLASAPSVPPCITACPRLVLPLRSFSV
ncbi:hypothetical protein S245_052771, partial [Arachis hypogaea]